MSVKIRGMKKLMDDLERHLGKVKMQAVTDRALKAGAKAFVKELQTQVRTFSDGKGQSEGYTYDEITVSEPFTQGGDRLIKVYWKGPHGRYRIIHLNEWGTIKNPSPRGKGKIAIALRNSEKEYARVVRKAIREGMR